MVAAVVDGDSMFFRVSADGASRSGVRRRGGVIPGIMAALCAGVSGCAEMGLDPLNPLGVAPLALRQPAPERTAAPETVPARVDGALTADASALAPVPAPLPAGAPAAAGADCKTVKLFDAVRPKMHRKAPDHLKPWLGHWGPGLWDGKLCHELVIEEIRADGTARIADLQGYYLPWDRWPTAFRREATFREDGALEVRQGRMGVAVYTLRDGVLHGAYSWGGDPLRVTLARKR